MCPLTYKTKYKNNLTKQTESERREKMVVENNEFQLSNVFGYKKVVKTSARRTFSLVS